MTGVVLRRGVYYYRVRVPADLASHFRRRHVRRSLRTRDPAAAQLLGSRWAAHTHRVFALLRTGALPAHEARSLTRHYLHANLADFPYHPAPTPGAVPESAQTNCYAPTADDLAPLLPPHHLEHAGGAVHPGACDPGPVDGQDPSRERSHPGRVPGPARGRARAATSRNRPPPTPPRGSNSQPPHRTPRLRVVGISPETPTIAEEKFPTSGIFSLLPNRGTSPCCACSRSQVWKIPCVDARISWELSFGGGVTVRWPTPCIPPNAPCFGESTGVTIRKT